MEVTALRGLKTLVVMVESHVKLKGYEPEVIKKSLERNLKGDGVPVVADESPHAGRLVVTLSPVVGEIVLVRFQLLRLASMDCEAEVFYTPMWEREYFSRGGKDNLPMDVTHTAATFAEDFNSINRR